MNAQEPKNKLRAINQLETARKAGKPFESKEYEDGYDEGLQFAQRVIDMMDEPQKPVVPKFVADYIEEYIDGGATLFEMMDNSKDEVYTWLFGSPRIETENERQLLFAQAYTTGYEVEKEPLYRVKLGEGYFAEYQGRGALIIPDDNKEIKVFNSKSDAERTASTIGGTVEEVAEGK